MEDHGEKQITLVASSKPEESLRFVQPEIRDFTINADKAIKKLQESANRSDISIERTGGGVTLKLNTGVYQIVKSAAHQFYTSEDQTHTCTITPVFDRKGHQIETKYKVFNGKASLYTFNLYHSRCSCLINGKDEEHFLTIDFPKIIDIVEKKLAEKKVTMSEFVENVKCTLQNVNMHVSDMSQKPLDEHGTRIDSGQNSVFLTDSPFVLPPNSLQDSYICSTPRINKDLMNSDLLQTVRYDLTNVLSLLREHIAESSRQMSTLRDEIYSIKSHVSLHCKQVSQKVETVENSSKSIGNLISTTSQSIQNRLQAISETVKKTQNIPNNEQKSTENRKMSPQIPFTEPSRPAPASDILPEPEQRPPFIGQLIPNTLLIGDSILKGIKTRGLRQDVKVITLPGKKARDACIRLQSWDLSECQNVVLYVGGNDVAAGNLVTSVEQEFRNTLDFLDNGQRKVFICLICPRPDINVNLLNNMIRRLCRETYAELIDLNEPYMRPDGRPLFDLFHADGIHPNTTGSSLLVKKINQAVTIIREQTDTVNGRQSYSQNDRKLQSPRSRVNIRHHPNDVMRTHDPATWYSWQYPRKRYIPSRSFADDGRSCSQSDGSYAGSPRRPPHRYRRGYWMPTQEHPIPSGSYYDERFDCVQRHNSHRSGSPWTARHGSDSRNPRYNRTLYYA